MMKKGDRWLTVITVLKTNGGTVTKLQFNGNEYALVHKDHMNGNKSKRKDG